MDSISNIGHNRAFILASASTLYFASIGDERDLVDDRLERPKICTVP